LNGTAGRGERPPDHVVEFIYQSLYFVPFGRSTLLLGLLRASARDGAGALSAALSAGSTIKRLMLRPSRAAARSIC